jgi:cytochrome c oxidase cbb3-type subunit IV
MTYDSVAAFARTWGLVYLAIMFACVIVYAFWPGSRRKFERHSQIPLEED